MGKAVYPKKRMDMEESEVLLKELHGPATYGNLPNYFLILAFRSMYMTNLPVKKVICKHVDFKLSANIPACWNYRLPHSWVSAKLT